MPRNICFRPCDICPERVIFATNTSTLSVSKLANVSGRPDRFIGMHFQPPVPGSLWWNWCGDGYQ